LSQNNRDKQKDKKEKKDKKKKTQLGKRVLEELINEASV
jgi:hypothetical protein